MSGWLPSIDWTTVLASAVTASILGGTQFITTRYLGRILDRWEKSTGKLQVNSKEVRKMPLQDWFEGLFGSPRRDMSTSVEQLEKQAGAAEEAAKLRTRAIEARRRIAAAKKVAPGRGLTFWVIVVGFLIIILVFARSCIAAF